ncbi:MAG: hypothetical protein MZV70_44875 [Desulfobacterales bacterium]|nr:hypothetical protein [Desulfobacterales bacterium]
MQALPKYSGWADQRNEVENLSPELWAQGRLGSQLEDDQLPLAELPVLDQAPKAKGRTGHHRRPLGEADQCLYLRRGPSRQDMTTRSVEVISDSGAAKTWAVAQVEVHVKKAD